MTAKGDSGFREVSHLIGLVALVGRLAQDRVAAGLSPLGVTYAQAVALVRLWRADQAGLRQSDLVESLGVSRAAGSEVLNQLDAQELVERGWDRLDARHRVVSLTERGRQLEEPVLAVFDEVEQDLRGSVHDGRSAAAFEELRVMLSNARNLRNGR